MNRFRRPLPFCSSHEDNWVTDGDRTHLGRGTANHRHQTNPATRSATQREGWWVVVESHHVLSVFSRALSLD